MQPSAGADVERPRLSNHSAARRSAIDAESKTVKSDMLVATRHAQRREVMEEQVASERRERAKLAAAEAKARRERGQVSDDSTPPASSDSEEES